MHGHATLCYIVVGGNLNSPLNLFISFAKALMEQGFRSDLFLAKDRVCCARNAINWRRHSAEKSTTITG